MDNRTKHLFSPFIKTSLLVVLILTATLMFPIILSEHASAQDNSVRVERGWTPIPDGEAYSETDITMKNEKLAITVTGSDGSTPPWGVPYGGILDGAAVVDGEIQTDQVTLIDFLPNRWAAWPTEYQELEIIEDNPERAVVEARRDWNEVDLVTTYTLESGDNFVNIDTTMENNSEETYTDMNSGYSLAIEGGWIFVPGGRGPREDTLADWMVGYNEGWAFGLHSDYHELVEGGTTWTEQYEIQTMESGETVSYSTRLQVEPIGDAARVNKFNMDLSETATRKISGEVFDSQGNQVDTPIVIAYKNNDIYTWTIGDEGNYELKLPEGDYELETVFENALPSSRQEVSIGGETEQYQADFDDVEAPGEFELQISDDFSADPLDARIELEGVPEYVPRFLGVETRFTELEEMGKANFPLPPGTFDMQIKSGANFVSQPELLEDITIESGEITSKEATVEIFTDPAEDNWYGVDLHQHSDIEDGLTSPKDLVRSNLAGQLDLVFLSDHDSVERHEEVHNYSEQRGVPFIPSIEISPMWAHFNVYPLPLSYDELPEDGEASEIFAAAREVNEEPEVDDVVIQVDHPWISYGYYYSLQEDDIPGGYDPGYDVVEWFADREETIEYLAEEYWDDGGEKFLVGSTDVHDVETTVTGYRRTYAYVEDELTPQNYSSAVKEGNAFVSYGPLIYPDQMFGEKHEAENGEFQLSFRTEAVKGLQEVHIYNSEGIKESELLSSEHVPLTAPLEKEFNFELNVNEDDWFLIRVIDEEGNNAISNPIWVEVN